MTHATLHSNTHGIAICTHSHRVSTVSSRIRLARLSNTRVIHNGTVYTVSSGNPIFRATVFSRSSDIINCRRRLSRTSTSAIIVTTSRIPGSGLILAANNLRASRHNLLSISRRNVAAIPNIFTTNSIIGNPLAIIRTITNTGLTIRNVITCLNLWLRPARRLQ